jgi:hypothetical protein
VQDTRREPGKKTNPAHRSAKKAAYQTPTVTDYGDVTRLTQQKGTSTDATGGQGFNKHPFG